MKISILTKTLLRNGMGLITHLLVGLGFLSSVMVSISRYASMVRISEAHHGTDFHVDVPDALDEFFKTTGKEEPMDTLFLHISFSVHCK